MAFCAGCGTEVGAGVAFCPKCGKATGAAAPPSSGAPAAAGGLAENDAALLSYVLGWLTGLIFFLIDKRPYVRFHAMQSIITFGALHIIMIVFIWGGFMGGMFMGTFGMSWLLYSAFNLLVLVLWVLCMVKAYQGQRFKLPVAGQLAENFAK